MKRDIAKLILSVTIALMAMAGSVSAVDPNTNTNTITNASTNTNTNTNTNTGGTAPAQNEVITENDRLPFMQSEETVASQEPTSGGLLLKTLGSMLLIVGLIFFGAWVAKKMGYGGKGNAAGDSDMDLAVLSTVSLGKDRSISMVRFGERVLVVGSTPNSFTLLAEEAPIEKISIENHRSVSEMLAEEEILFAAEFEKAESVIRGYEGGQI